MNQDLPINFILPKLTSLTVHKAALAYDLRSPATPTSGTCLIAPVASNQKSYLSDFWGEIEESCLLVCHFYLPKDKILSARCPLADVLSSACGTPPPCHLSLSLSLFSCAPGFGKMPRRTKAELARDKARKQVQNLFDKFKEPIGYTNVYGGYQLQFDGPTFLNDDDLTRLQVKLLPSDVGDTAIPNSAPSFFTPWSVRKLKDHPVDVKAMKGDGLEALEVGEPFTDASELFTGASELLTGPSNPLHSPRNVHEFIKGQYYHVPRANLGPNVFETLSHHSRWQRVSWVTLLNNVGGTSTDSDSL
jgi:hypothetical protein